MTRQVQSPKQNIDTLNLDMKIIHEYDSGGFIPRTQGQINNRKSIKITEVSSNLYRTFQPKQC